ncbi:MAG: hypothetical protein CM1200mP18_16510 [Gammaproteobacteria bacterium]|nr:MAG: hypothetical protein CM1200mP18_16510 [Gammaproteobacteria bacterium]
MEGWKFPCTVRRDPEYMRTGWSPIVGMRREVTATDRIHRAMTGMLCLALVQCLRSLCSADYGPSTQSLQPGLLEPHIQPLRERIRRFLGSGQHPAKKSKNVYAYLYGSRQIERGICLYR